MPGTGHKATVTEWKSKLPLPATSRWPAGVWDVEALRHGSMSAILFTPKGKDHQQPHSQDEVYVIVTGSAELFLAEESGERRLSCAPGDVLFVPAGIVHRFEHISEDFITWAILWGPQGGEAQ